MTEAVKTDETPLKLPPEYVILLFQATMEVTTLLLFVVVTAASMLLFFRDPRRARMVRLIEKLPGPFAFPMFGTALPFILASRNSAYDLAYRTEGRR